MRPRDGREQRPARPAVGIAKGGRRGVAGAASARPGSGRNRPPATRRQRLASRREGSPTLSKLGAMAMIRRREYGPKGSIRRPTVRRSSPAPGSSRRYPCRARSRKSPAATGRPAEPLDDPAGHAIGRGRIDRRAEIVVLAEHSRSRLRRCASCRRGALRPPAEASTDWAPSSRRDRRRAGGFAIAARGSARPPRRNRSLTANVVFGERPLRHEAERRGGRWLDEGEPAGMVLRNRFHRRGLLGGQTADAVAPGPDRRSPMNSSTKPFTAPNRRSVKGCRGTDEGSRPNRTSRIADARRAEIRTRPRPRPSFISLTRSVLVRRSARRWVRAMIRGGLRDRSENRRPRRHHDSWPPPDRVRMVSTTSRIGSSARSPGRCTGSSGPARNQPLLLLAVRLPWR